MKKYIGILLLLLAGSVAHAGAPPIQITFPVGGECVNNGDEIFRGGIVGGEAQAQPIDVPLVFNAYSFDGSDLVISFLIEWTATGLDGEAIERSEMYEAILQLPANEVVEVDQFPVPGFFIEDADDVRITVRATHPVDGLFEDSVVFDLDRRAPTVVMQPADLANAQSVCDANPPPFAYSLTDERTPEADIISDIRTEVDGCIVNRIITVRDTCGTGNAQELTITSSAPAAPNSIDVSIEGYRCTVDGCITEGDGAMPFGDGDRVSMPTFLPVVNAPQGCASNVSAVVMRAEDVVDQCPAEPPSVTGGAGDECVQDGDCSGQQTCTNGFCAEPVVCAADVDCRAGRLCRDDGCVSPCMPLQGGRVFDDAGDYLARVRVSDCGGNQVETSMTVTVLERPIAMPGGNLPNGDYQVRQGEALVLDGSTSFAAPEVGGITEYAWDLDGDGFFNVDNEVFAGGQPTVEFDTFQSGTFRRRLRVTAGNGTTAYAWFNVIVEDVDPICSAGGPYEVSEGEALRLDARASQAGHEGDPIQFYSWDFGDGFRPQSGAGLREPLHIYRDASDEPFVVTLTVADPDSEAQCTALVTVRDVAPQLDGVTVLNPQAAIEGETLRFEAQARPGSQSDPLTYFAWQFGPIGASAEGPAERTASYTYQDHGTYDVCVTVQDEDSSVEECVAVEIEDLQPFVSLEGPNRGLQGEELVFDASNTQAGGPSDALTMLVWNWGDGSNLETVQIGNNLPNQFVGRHIYPEDGEYTITLRVVDEDSAAVVQHVVTIEDAEPTADFTFAYPGLERTIPEGVELLLDASNSRAGANTDPIEAYIWDFGDGNERTLAANQVGVTYSWADEGAYEVRLTARDDDGSESTQMRIIEVTNRPPQVSLQTETNQVAIGENILFVALSGEVPDVQDGARVVALVDDVQGDLPPARVSWDMGDGSQIESGSHRYAYNTLGPKVVRVTIDDGDGGVTEEEIVLNVTPAAPMIEAVPPQQVSEGEQLIFDVLVQAPVIGPGVFDQIEVNTVEAPPGADVEYIAEDNNIRVRFSWRPTFYDSGYHRLWLRANSSEAERLRIIDINVDDAGVPRLVTVSGSPSRGVLNFYDYERGVRDIVLRSNPEIELGLGVGGLCASPDGRFVWVTVPGSNKVAVVSTSGAGALVRRVPVPAMPVAATFGGEHVWVVNHLDNSLTAINAETMKVVTTLAFEGVHGPNDIVWLPENEDGGARLAVVTSSGHLLIIDAQVVLTGGLQPVVATRQVGGVLNRMVMDSEAGLTYIADAKTRRVYRMETSTLADEDGAVEGLSVAFAARDLHASGGAVWVATEVSLVEWTAERSSSNDLIRARAVGGVIEQAVATGALAVATSSRIENFDADDLTRITDIAGTSVRRMMTLVAPR